MSPQTIRPGDRVRDSDDPDPNDAIVVNRPPQTASEWEIDSRDCTLADDNPDYPEQAAVIVVCFVDDLVEYGPPFDPTDQTELSLATLNEVGVHFYTFPAPRLDVIESPATGLPGTEPTTADESEPTAATTSAEDDTATEPAHATEQPADETADESATETDPSPKLQHLHTTLEANGLTVESTDDDTLTVERLGQTYRIHADGSVAGDGALRAKLETLVADAV
jgi:hypothetical protein